MTIRYERGDGPLIAGLIIVVISVALLVWYSPGMAADYPPVNPETGAMKFITYQHHEIHRGSSYSTHYNRTTTSDDDHRSAIGFSASDTTKWAHAVITVTASSPAEFTILEAPTVDLAAGTEKTIYNRDRNSANTSTILNMANPQVAGSVTTFTEGQIAAANLSGGTMLAHYFLAGGEGPKAIGGVSRGSQEWILDQDSKYLLIMQNIGANANLHCIHFDWYEHTNQNP